MLNSIESLFILSTKFIVIDPEFAIQEASIFEKFASGKG